MVGSKANQTIDFEPSFCQPLNCVKIFKPMRLNATFIFLPVLFFLCSQSLKAASDAAQRIGNQQLVSEVARNIKLNKKFRKKQKRRERLNNRLQKFFKKWQKRQQKRAQKGKKVLVTIDALGVALIVLLLGGLIFALGILIPFIGILLKIAGVIIIFVGLVLLVASVAF